MRLFWLTAVVAFLIDQASKARVFAMFDSLGREWIDIAAPWLVFRRGMNTGVNFGLFADASEGQRWMLIGLSLVLCTALTLWARRSFHRPVQFLAGGLVIGGALGNALDRLFYPGVRDFLNMSCCGITNPYVFNVADVFIFAGAIGLVLFGPEGKRRKKPS